MQKKEILYIVGVHYVFSFKSDSRYLPNLDDGYKNWIGEVRKHNKLKQEKKLHFGIMTKKLVSSKNKTFDFSLWGTNNLNDNNGLWI